MSEQNTSLAGERTQETRAAGTVKQGRRPMFKAFEDNETPPTREMQTEQTGHTPAPWKVVKIGLNVYVESYADNLRSTPFICDLQADDRPESDSGADERAYHARIEADARLIASAPELLQALRELLNTTEGADADKKACKCLRCKQAKEASYAAIAKATRK